MADLPNSALGRVLVRTLAPMLPVWLSGLVLALLLTRLGLTGGPLPAENLELFFATDSALVVILVAFLAFYQYRSTPHTVRVDFDGVTGWVPRSGGERDHGRRRLTFPYASVRAVVRGSLFGYRVEARAPNGSAVDWLNLTEANAAVVAAAWEAWRQREGGASDG